MKIFELLNKLDEEFDFVYSSVQFCGDTSGSLIIGNGELADFNDLEVAEKLIQYLIDNKQKGTYSEAVDLAIEFFK